jgi:predicted ATPase
MRESTPGNGRYLPRIRTPDQRLRVFVSSTVQELAEERAAVKEAIQSLRLSPVLFELGARPHPPQEVYRSYLAQSDVFVGIYWQWYGRAHTGGEISDLEEEFRQSEGMPRLIYVKEPAREREPSLSDFLKRLCDSGDVSYKVFSRAEQLAELVQDDLALLLTEGFSAPHLQGRMGAGVGSQEPEFAATTMDGALLARRLPIPPTAIVGREQEVEAVSDLLLRPEVSLLTLTGPGGCGKTRLGLEVAHLLAGRFPDGAVFVNLTAVEDAVLVASTIAATFGLPEAPGGTPEEALAAYLVSRRLLLVLDNFEHLLGAASLVARLLESAGNLKILVTSRTPLRLRVEKEFLVAPLACPPADREIMPSEIEDFPALKLLVDRIRAAHVDYSLTDTNVHAMVEICRRVDGLPLAIELAAARSRLLSAPELLSRLERGLDVLGAEIRDLPKRQRTLAATIDWSYRLLDEPARTLFRRLAVFGGSWTLEAAEQVWAMGDEPVDIVTAMQTLLEASLIQRREEPGFGLRFTMLQTVREFAAEQLRAAGEEEDQRARRLHAHWLCAFSESATRGLRSAERVYWSRSIELELDNIRAALAWSASPQGEVEIGVRVVWDLLWFVEMRSVASEGLFWLDCLGSRLGADVDSALQVRWLLVRGALAFMRLEAEGVLGPVEEALAVLDAENDPEALGIALVFEAMALTTSERGHTTAQALLRRAITVLEGIDATWETAFAYSWLTFAFVNNNQPEEGWHTEQQALDLFRRTGDPWGIGVSMFAQALVQSGQANLAGAEASIRESVQLLTATQDLWLVPWVTAGLGLVLLLRHKWDEAEAYFRQALILGRDYSNASGLRIALAGLAGLEAAGQPYEGGVHEPHPLRAARLLGAAAGRTTRGSLRPWPAWDGVMESLKTAIRLQLDDSEWEREYAAGQRLSAEEAVSYACSSG